MLEAITYVAVFCLAGVFLLILAAMIIVGIIGIGYLLFLGVCELMGIDFPQPVIDKNPPPPNYSSASLYDPEDMEWHRKSDERVYGGRHYG